MSIQSSPQLPTLISPRPLLPSPTQINHQHDLHHHSLLNDDDRPVDLSDFQAKLERSLGNLHRLVESWIPTDLLNSSQDQIPLLQSSSSHNSKSSRLGLGSQRPSGSHSASASKLHQQLTKKKTGHAKAHLECAKEVTVSLPEEIDGQDSRSLSFGGRASRQDPLTSLLHQPTSSASVPANDPPAELERPKDSLGPLRQPVAIMAGDRAGGLSKGQLKRQRKLERLRLATQLAAADRPVPPCAKPSDPHQTISCDSSNASLSAISTDTPSSSLTRTTPDQPALVPIPMTESSSSHCQASNGATTTVARDDHSSRSSKKNKRKRK